MRPHEWSGATTPEDRICICGHSHEDHIYRTRRDGLHLVCEERGCEGCRDFVCADHYVADINGERPDCFEEIPAPPHRSQTGDRG